MKKCRIMSKYYKRQGLFLLQLHDERILEQDRPEKNKRPFLKYCGKKLENDSQILNSQTVLVPLVNVHCGFDLLVQGFEDGVDFGY